MRKIDTGFISDILEYIGYVEKFISEDPPKEKAFQDNVRNLQLFDALR